MIREQRGAAEAESLLEDLGIDTLPIDPMMIANEISDSSFQLIFEQQPFQSAAILGKAIGNDAGAVVYINSNIPDDRRLKFTAAHELGHVCMHIMPGVKTQFECGSKEIDNPFDDPREQEANGFSSGLLMPSKLIQRITDGDINWSNIERLKNQCHTSLEATFRRMIVLSHEPAALVIHQSGKFKRFVSSTSFSAFITQTPLSHAQLQLCSDGIDGGLPADFDAVDADLWVNPHIAGDRLHVIYSSSITLTNGFVYTLLRYDDDCFEEIEEA